MRLVHLSILASTLMGGCIIYEEKVVVRGDHGEEYCDDGPGSDGWDDQDIAPMYWLTPGIAAPGETLIVSLESDQAIDWESVSDLHFYGDVSVCTTSARDDELLVTISVSPEALEGPVDMLIIFGEGEPAYVPAALTISGAGGGDGTEDPTTGDPTTGDPGDGSSGDPSDGSDGGADGGTGCGY